MMLPANSSERDFDLMIGSSSSLACLHAFLKAMRPAVLNESSLMSTSVVTAVVEDHAKFHHRKARQYDRARPPRRFLFHRWM